MKGDRILNELKEIFGCELDKDLLSEFSKIDNIHQSQVSRWRTSGFYRSTEIIIERLLLEIKDLRNQLDKQ